MSKQSLLFDGVNPTARREFDYYPTPRWMTEALIDRARPFDVLEPCAGDGAIVRVFQAHGVRVWTNDIDLARATDWHEDATTEQAWEVFGGSRYTGSDHYFWTVTNPPFNLAEVIVPLAVRVNLPVAMLLRLSWLEPTDGRQMFLAEHPPARLIVLPRYDFRGNGSTDSVTSAWMIWDNASGRRGVEVVTKAERDRLIAKHGDR